MNILNNGLHCLLFFDNFIILIKTRYLKQLTRLKGIETTSPNLHVCDYSYLKQLTRLKGIETAIELKYTTNSSHLKQLTRLKGIETIGWDDNVDTFY